VHYMRGCDPVGTEFRVPGPNRYRLDGYDAGRNIGIEFLGNVYHGWPPGHPRHNERSFVTGKPGTLMYHATMTRLYEVKEAMPAGFKLFYIWEHEFAKIRKNPCEDIQKVMHEL